MQIYFDHWYPLEEWHEDFHDCLFLFFKGKDLACAKFTSPLSSEWSENDLDDHDEIYFKRIDTSTVQFERDKYDYEIRKNNLCRICEVKPCVGNHNNCGDPDCIPF